ncbi:MAG: hypothetical protein NTZ38_02575 [Candidatus Taylorbacteria bacterium]|nr:hypothetical protein [Candidatus Taylorbacteria bacterium]
MKKKIISLFFGLVLLVGSVSVSADSPAPAVNVVAWGGSDYFGEKYIPPITNAIQISVGTTHALALKADGTVVSWGSTNDPLLNVPADLTNVTRVVQSQSHSLALKADGTLVAWGYNDYGGAYVPYWINATGVKDMAAGTYTTTVIFSNGTVTAWGYNHEGECNIPADLTNAIAVSSGHVHTLCLRADGTVVAWGDNSQNQCNIPTGLSNVVAVSAGQFHSLALKDDGMVVAWGDNEYDQCDVPDGLVAVSVSAGGSFNLALKADGKVVSWGNYLERWMPENLTNIVQVGAGFSVGIALVGLPAPTTQPVIIHALTNRTFSVGSDISFRVIIGGPDLVYRWYFDSSLIEGATNAVLKLTNIQAEQSGRYSVTASNAWGMVTSLGDINILPTLGMIQLPCVLLGVGKVGTYFHLQYINGVGPTNAWMDLITIPVTNMVPVEYIDRSAFGMPMRLYRWYQSSP